MTATALQEIATAHPALVRDAQEKYKEIFARSMTDPRFRQYLLNEPATAIKEVTGEDVGAFKFVFVEQCGVPTVVLPDYVDPDAELDERSLESVAGGSEPCIAVLCFVGGMALGAWGTTKVLEAISGS